MSMKFYELDLSQLVPDGIPINVDDKTDSKGHVNDFFLQGFDDYYNQLFKVDQGLVYDYSRSCQGLYSTTCSLLSSDDELARRILDAGLYYYNDNSHDSNATFAQRINLMQSGREDDLKFLVMYAADMFGINIDVIYEGYQPYCYGLNIYGDITATSNTENILTRLLQCLTVLTPAHTKLKDVSFEDAGTDLYVYAALVGDDVSYMYKAYLPVPIRERIVIGQTTTVPLGTTKLVSKYWWMDNFGYASGLSNLWTPAEYASPVTDMSGLVDIDDTEFNEAIFTDNGSYDNFGDNGWMLKLNMYSSRPEMWTDTNDAISDPSKCGIIVVPGANPTWTTQTEWELPSTLYSINGTTVTWNNSHILMNLFSGSYGYAVGEG